MEGFSHLALALLRRYQTVPAGLIVLGVVAIKILKYFDSTLKILVKLVKHLNSALKNLEKLAKHSTPIQLKVTIGKVSKPKTPMESAANIKRNLAGRAAGPSRLLNSREGKQTRAKNKDMPTV
jgi:hypothetical protein